MLCCMNNVNESNFFLVVVFVFLFINSCSDNNISSSDDFDLSNSDNNDKVFTERFSGTFWQNNDVPNFQRVLSFDKSSLFKLLSLTTTDVNPKWYCYFWQEGVFNLNYFEEGYDKTIIEISKNEKDLFEIDEIASYTNSDGGIENLDATISFTYTEADNSIRMDVVCDGKNTEPVVFTYTEFEESQGSSDDCIQVYVIGGC